MNAESPTGYTEETARKYTEGQKQFFDADKVIDSPTVAMENEARSIAEQHEIHTVCDIGCGSNCSYLEGWKQGARAKRIIGVEPSPHMREILEKDLSDSENGSCVEVTSGDWEHIPLPDGSVDLAVSRFSLHYLENISTGYAELARILRTGGFAVISLPHPEYCARELAKNGIEPKEGVPMSVEVFDTTLNYFYHEVGAYLGDSLAQNGLALVKQSEFNWGTKDESDKNIPNTLLFVLEKI